MRRNQASAIRREELASADEVIHPIKTSNRKTAQPNLRLVPKTNQVEAPASAQPLQELQLTADELKLQAIVDCFW